MAAIHNLPVELQEEIFDMKHRLEMTDVFNELQSSVVTMKKFWMYRRVWKSYMRYTKEELMITNEHQLILVELTDTKEELVRKRIKNMWPFLQEPHESLMRKMKKEFELQNDKENEGTPNSQVSFMF